MLNELGMKMCKICGSECSWVFCIDCEKLIGNGIDDMKADLAAATDREKRLVDALERLVCRHNNHDAHLEIAVEAELANRQCPVCDACDSIWAIIHPEDAEHKGEK